MPLGLEILGVQVVPQYIFDFFKKGDAPLALDVEHQTNPVQSQGAPLTLDIEHDIDATLSQNLHQNPRLHALFIGIDEYERPGDRLRAAVADAKAMEGYVRQRFPLADIRCLHNEQATRDSIVKAIEDLIASDEVQLDDPILIFYAGHGSRAIPPTRWGISDERIEILLPQDFHKKRIITDRGLATLLDKLASVKGDNIVVILDCCHAGSMSRVSLDENDEHRARGLSGQDLKPLEDDTDKDIFEAHCLLGDAPSLRLGSASHVLLAACGPSQQAYESLQGDFTQAILSKLSDPDSNQLSYSELITSLPPLPRQTPRCEGDKRDRILFSSIISQNQDMYKVSKTGSAFEVNVGTIRGIATGTRLAVFRTQDINVPPIGVFPVVNANTSSCTLSMPDSMPITLPAYALQVKDLNVYFASNPETNSIKKAFKKRQKNNASQLFHYSFAAKEQAPLEVRAKGDFAVFYNLISKDQFKDQYKGQLFPMPYRVKKGQDNIISNVIYAANEFARLLHLTPKISQLKGYIKVQYTQVKRIDFGLVMRTGENLCNASGIVEVTAGNTLYGIEIKNDSDIQIYPHVLLFDFNDLSIEYYYRPPTVGANDGNTALQPGDILNIGFGTGGKGPWRHFLLDPGTLQGGKVFRDAENIGLCAFKFFFTTKPFDLSSFEQKSPFKEEYYRKVGQEDFSEVNEWDTLSVSVVAKGCTSSSVSGRM
ncbi:hypothetical protein CPB86DRAFT_764005 [Serendipita vermifera]|nr:hypothetical protein CPB86DRAFT_764005 [Serendipita vermifera]